MKDVDDTSIPTTEALLERGRAAWKANKADPVLSAFEVDALTDIGQRVAKYGGFKTEKQRAFFVKLIERVEGVEDVAKPDPTLTSPSGIDGARY